MASSSAAGRSAAAAASSSAGARARRRAARRRAAPRSSAAAAAAGKASGKDDVFGVDLPARYEKLQAGQANHTLTVFVADESGLINRVSSVFARRGYNIESLAVGLSNDRALFTVVVNGNDRMIVALCKQLRKLVNVRVVEDLTPLPRVEREMVLIKVRVTDDTRTEAMQLVDVFRGRVVDVAEGAITAEVTGDPGKTVAAQQALARFGVLEIVRTGRVALRRDLPGWERLLAAQQLDGETSSSAAMGQAVSLQNLDAKGAAATDTHTAGRARPKSAAAEMASSDSDSEGDPGGDVYAVPILDPLALAVDGPDAVRSHILSVTVDNSAGVLNRVTAVLSRRGYNIQSLAVGPSETVGESRITTVVPGSDGAIKNLVRQIEKLINVKEVADITDVPCMKRELMLLKVGADARSRREILDVAEIFRARCVDTSQATMCFEVTGNPKKMAAFQQLLAPYGVLEVGRTGIVAMKRESQVDSRFLSVLRHTDRTY